MQDWEFYGSDSNRISVRGCGAGPEPVLLVHGLGEGKCVWNGVCERLGEHNYVFALDLRGHGGSSWDVTQAYSTEKYVEDVRDCLAWIGASKFTLVGHSLGAEIVVRVAADSTNLKSLVLIEFATEPLGRAIDKGYKAFASRLKVFTSQAEYRQLLANQYPFARSSILDEIADEFVDYKVGKGFAAKCDPALVNRVERPSEPELWALLKRIEVPMLHLRGQYSSIFPHGSEERLRHAFPQIEFDTVRRSGHNVMVDNPEGVSSRISTFLQGSSYAGRGS